MFVLPTKTRYFPRNLAIASTRGEGVHEFLVVWNHEYASLVKILETFSKHEAKVILAHSQLEEATGMVVGTFYCGLAKPDRDSDAIRDEIKGLSFVQTVESASTEQSLFDKFLFPVTIWGSHRVLVMRLSPMLNIENRLVKELGSVGSAIMFREGEGYAAETLKQYREVLGSITTESLLENVKDGLRATGWGLFEFKKTKDGYEVTVQEAAAVQGPTEPSRFLCGIIAGILESVYATKVMVVESTIDLKSGTVFVKLSKASDGSAV